MIRITAQLDEAMSHLAGRQLPFAASLALNRTAMEARDEVREGLPQRFKLRNNWTRRGVQVRTSNKANLVASVLAPGYMEIQETGGTRTPTRSRLLAAPAQAMQGDRVIPRSKRPRALIDSGKAFLLTLKDGRRAIFQRYGKKRKDIRLAYWLTEDQQYEDRFEFAKTVESKVARRFSVNFAAALAQASSS